MIWNKEIECADRETMRALQLKKLKETVKYEYDNVPYYRKKMDDAGVKPEDIRILRRHKKITFHNKRGYCCKLSDRTLCKTHGRNSEDTRFIRNDRQA